MMISVNDAARFHYDKWWDDDEKKYEKFSTPLSYRVVVVIKCRAYFLLIANFLQDIFAPTMIRIILILHSNQQSNEKFFLLSSVS